MAAVCELLHSALFGRSNGTRGASPAARTSQVFPLSWLATADEVIDLLRLLTAAHGTTQRLFRRTNAVAIEGIADMPGASRTSRCDANDPIRSLTEAKCRTAASPWPDPNPLCCHRLGAADAFRSANETPVHRAGRQRGGGVAAAGGASAA